MSHTYLRYECADAFGVVAQTATSTRTPAAADGILAAVVDPSNRTTSLLTTAGSHVVAWNITTGLPVLKLGHAEFTGIGTGRALNTGQVLCLDTHLGRLATGWMDGAVRVFELTSNIGSGGTTGNLTAFTLQETKKRDDDDGDDDDGTAPERPDPLTLNGHTPSPVRVVRLERPSSNQNNDNNINDTCSRLASGGSDGSVIVWDLVAESGLFRLLGHQQGITNLEFVANSDTTTASAATSDYLVSTSLDGLIKVWDLAGQCCVQTLLMAGGGGGQVWSSTLVDWNRYEKDIPAATIPRRQRLLTGSVDGQVRIWAVEIPTSGSTTNIAEHPQQPDDNHDTVCRDMGWLDAPSPHLATSSSAATRTAVASKERVMSIQASPYSRHVGVLQANSKDVHIYAIRNLQDSTRKRHRRLQRRQEKLKLKQKQQNQQEGDDENDQKKRKKGILDDSDDDNDKAQDAKDQDNTNDETTKLTTRIPTCPLEDFQANDELEYVGTIRASHKVKAFVFVPRPNKSQQGAPVPVLRVACALSTNTLEIYSLIKEQAATTTTPSSPIPRFISERGSNLTALHGHPTGVRAMAMSTNDDLVVTISKNICKVWNVGHRSCLLSLVMEATVPAAKKKQQPLSCQGLCCVFLPGNSHVVVGTKEGHLLVIDTAACDIVYWKRKAHDDAIWSMDISYRRGRVDDLATTIITGSADKTVKFWRVELQQDHDGDDSDNDDDEDMVIGVSGAPMLVPTRMLEMTDEVVAVRYSQNHLATADRRMVFVSTLDCTIKVFYDDSLKMFLSLYGHKLPALAVDASDDDVLLASASADKTIKLWGLDFGDTHRTLHGHEDSVTDIAFVRGTHNFFSCSKDGTVRFWDGDRFELVLVLRGHSAEVNCLAVSARNQGAVCLSGGMDRQVRVWERTRDIVFLEEERERELEKMFDDPTNRGTQQNEGGTASILARRSGRNEDDGNDLDEDAIKDQEPQTEAAVKQSVMNISAGDRILEAIELADQELQSSRNASKKNSATANPMLLGMEPSLYILWVLRSIKSVELEQSLLILPLSHAERLLYYLVILLRGGHTGVELCARVAVFTVKTYQHQLVLKQNSMAPLLRELRRLIRLRLGQARDTVGYNMAACRMIGRLAQERQLNKVSAVMPSTDIWAGLGLGSDVAAAIQGSGRPRK